MHIIPVIDVRMELAVRAVAGDRANYRPLETPLAAGSDPVAVALGYRQLFPFPTLYLADLDGIEGIEGQERAGGAMQQRLAAAWGHGELWIDDGSVEHMVQGSDSSTRAPPLHGAGMLGAREASGSGARVKRVSGSESLGGQWQPQPLPDEAILSLDFRGEEFMGPRAFLDEPSLWPSRLIVMTLGRVGRGGGPDVDRVREIVDRAGSGRRVYAAGGVRDRDDLLALRDIGAAGALIASALHAGKIKTGDLEEIAGFKFQST